MSSFQFKNGTDSSTRFYLYTGDLPSDITNSQPNSLSDSESSLHRTGFTEHHGSLSGAPYLLTYNLSTSSNRK